MGADIENPDNPDGCIAAAEPSRNTFKERLVASFLRNPSGAAGSGDAKAAKTPNGAGAGAGADVAAAEPANAKRGWRYYVLHACSVITYLVFAASMFPLMYRDKDRLHIAAASIGVIGGIIMTLFLCGAAEVE